MPELALALREQGGPVDDSGHLAGAIQQQPVEHCGTSRVQQGGGGDWLEDNWGNTTCPVISQLEEATVSYVPESNQ